VPGGTSPVEVYLFAVMVTAFRARQDLY